MTQTLPIFSENIIGRGDASALSKKSTFFNSFLQKSQFQTKPLSIISVHGGKSLDKQIAFHAPEQTEFVRITHGLQNYFSKPRFDLIFFSTSGNKHDYTELYEQLSYCRMLLKPGGGICFLVEENHKCGLLQKIVWKKSMEAGLITRTGFIQLHRKKMGQEIFLCGIRPKTENLCYTVNLFTTHR